MRLLISPNLKLDNARDITIKVAEGIINNNMQPCVIKSSYEFLSLKNVDYIFSVESISECDIVVAVGGDGTIFHCAFDALMSDKPILGINAGRLGFLSQMEISDLSCLSQISKGDYSIENISTMPCVF